MSTIVKRDSSHESGGVIIGSDYHEEQRTALNLGNLRKSPEGKSESKISFVAATTGQGNNVPWGHANDKRKLSSKMFSMTAKIEARPMTAKYESETLEYSPPKFKNPIKPVLGNKELSSFL
jgi:hypothetical protein